MARISMTLTHSLFCFALAVSLAPLAAAESEKTSRELIQYVQEASQLGLKEADIRQNAVTAGYDKASVEQAVAIVHYMRTNTTPPPAGGFSPKPFATPSDYRIGAGDVLQVVVWKEPEASAAGLVVRADGKISLPLVKETDVLGLSPSELEKSLAEKLGRYIHDADVTVLVTSINSRKVYMVGAVKKEGPVPLQSSMTVLQAISEAGGLNDYAKRKKIYVLRTEGGRQFRLPFDYQSVIRGERTEENVEVRPGDMIVVPH